jgi:rhodanese-related sulfurtransferase
MTGIRFMTMLGLFATVVAQATAEPAGSSDRYFDSKTPTAYCGLYCTLAAAHCFGMSPPFEPMLDEQYMTGKYGSTNLDLIRLLDSIDLKGTFRSDLTLDDLRLISTPIILHTRNPSGVSYNHWLLFSGFDAAGNVMAYDPPDGTGPISAAELLAVWDGAGVIVTERKNGNRPFVWPVSFTSLAVVAVTGVFIWTIGTKARGIALIIAVSILSSAFIHFGSTGFFRNRDGVNTVIAAHFDTPLKVIRSAELRSKLDADEVVLVDARSAEAFKSFHLPGAINIPIGSGVVSLAKRIEALRVMSADKPIVVYCRGPQCGWADKVGSLISVRTGRTTLVYRDGALGWVEQMKGA